MSNGINGHLPQMVFTVKETAEILKVSEKTVYRLVERKMLHAIKALRHLRVTKKSLDVFLASASGEEAGCE
jgi:excisionase family DNA binding protein